MKYKDVDWSRWDDRPEENTYNDWCVVRKAKMTQTAINRTAPHINKLYQAGVSADEAVAIATEKEWRGIKYQWVMNEIMRDMDGLSDFSPARKTRDIPLIEQCLDRRWAE